MVFGVRRPHRPDLPSGCAGEGLLQNKLVRYFGTLGLLLCVSRVPCLRPASTLRMDQDGTANAYDTDSCLCDEIVGRLQQRTNGRKRDWRRAFHRDDRRPAERRPVNEFVGFCGCSGCFRQVQGIPHAKLQFLLSACAIGEPPSCAERAIPASKWLSWSLCRWERVLSQLGDGTGARRSRTNNGVETVVYI
jgi:hypothetical protein